MECCIICETNHPPIIQSARLEAIRSASKQRGDGLGEKFHDAVDPMPCHRNCVSTYCSKHHIQRYIGKRKLFQVTTPSSSSVKRLRKESFFDFKQHCLFCGEECIIDRSKKNPNRWKEAYICRTADRCNGFTFKAAILKRSLERNDAISEEVRFRMSSVVSDLHAADARYHKDCMCKFFTNDSPHEQQGDHFDEAFKEVVKVMLSDRSYIWNSIELHNLYSEMGGKYLSRRVLVDSLSKTLESDLVIFSCPGIASILAFRSEASGILRIVDDSDDCLSRSVTRSAIAIQSECTKNDQTIYETRLTKESMSEQCSDTLLLLLSKVSPKLDFTLPAFMINHIVTSMVTNQPTGLQIALGVLLDRQKNLIDNLNRFGVTCTYNEVRRFKISSAKSVSLASNSSKEFDSQSGLVQVVADNFDAQLSTLNGKKSTHGLAMIVTQSMGKHSSKEIRDTTIKRLSREETAADRLDFQEPQVKHYLGPMNPAMPTDYCIQTVLSLAQLATQRIVSDRAHVEDFVFFKSVISNEDCPEYSGYNTRKYRKSGCVSESKTKIAYSPFIDMNPTEPDTIKTAMVEAQRISLLAGQEWTIFTTDQQLYQIAVQLTWNEPELFSDVILRLGGMHMVMNFVGCVGTLMGGSGMNEILESTFAGVQKMLSGKKFPQNIRALRLLVEEILRPVLLNQHIESFDELMSILETKSSMSRTAKLWVDCLIKPIFIILTFIRAEREGDWNLHLYSVKQMLPYFFAAGHYRYARYGLYYLRSMERLPTSLYPRFLKGEHVMRHRDGLWNGIWSDMYIETTYMRYGHGPSGIIGNTLNESTLAIWAFSKGACVQLLTDLDELTDTKKQFDTHKEEATSRMKADADDRSKLREALSLCIGILDVEEHIPISLCNIYNGKIFEKELINVDMAVQIGQKQCAEYESNLPLGFYNKLSKNITTLETASKKIKIDNDHCGMNTELIYARVIGIMASSRETVSVQDLLSYELTQYPPALFDEKGNLRQTNKSVLKNKLQVMGNLRTAPKAEVLILDANALLWTVSYPSAPAKLSTFINAAVDMFIRQSYYASKVVHIVFDRYYEFSNKSCCRSKRQNGCSRKYQLNKDSPLPKKELLLNVTENKKQLIQLLVNELIKMNRSEIQIIITGPHPNPIEVGRGSLPVPILHEEADVIMVYHMLEEAKHGLSPIWVVSDDTDVLLILAYHLHTNLQPFAGVNIFMKSCHANTSLINVNDVVNTHTNIIPNILAAHSLTGCDTTSSFSGIGKATVLKKLRQFPDILSLGNPNITNDEITKSSYTFIKSLYPEDHSTSLNKLRSSMFSKKIAAKQHTPPKLCSLPPTNNAFIPHCLRAHLQCILWKSADAPSPPHIDIENFGWRNVSGSLEPIYILDKEIAPKQVLEIISCGCKKGCKSLLCMCKKYSLPCSELCKCSSLSICENSDPIYES